MKTADYLSKFKNLKTEIRIMAHKVMLSRMVADNLRDIIPTAYQIEPVSFSYGVRISPVDAGMTVDHFPKLTARLTKIFHRKPSVEVSKEYMTATWWIYPGFEEKFISDNQIRIELVFGNTEKCELIPKTLTYEGYELTGYCKAVKEMNYDTN